MRLAIASLIILLLTITAGFGQENDSTFVPPVSDSTGVDSLTPLPDTSLAADTLTEIEKAKRTIQKRMAEYKEEAAVKREPSLSYFDSAVVYFVSSRTDRADDARRSHYHDAGDFFRFDPSYFIVEYQDTPTRNTVQPFGLSSGRLNFVVNGTPLYPFEHVLEPDGLVDLNDIPTTTCQRAYLIPGPTGQLFGGQQAVATFLSLPQKPESHTPESSFLVDQGSYEYNYVRGRYGGTFSNGREIDLSVGYRNADGVLNGLDDDAYHYTGRVFWPIGLDYGIRFSGQLYDRVGRTAVRPNVSSARIDRDRIDRTAQISLERLNPAHTTRTEVGYRYLKQGSHLNGTYDARFNRYGDGIFVGREWTTGSSVVRTEVRADQETFADGYDEFDRYSSEANLKIVRTTKGWRYGVTAGATLVESYPVLPTASLTLHRETDNSLVVLSVGYSERAPSLYELNLRHQRAWVYPTQDASTPLNYADQGNPDLSPEKQIAASATIELGAPANSLRLSLTGGTLMDGIEWRNEQVFEEGDVPYRLFSPTNDDLGFLNATLEKKFKLIDLFTFSAGGSYHWIDYRNIENPPYSPDYQAFASGELHIYWPQKIMHLFAYGEIVYVGEYDGYHKSGIGNAAITNVKLSFKIKDFRFHVAIHNPLVTEFESRESWGLLSRSTYYGLTWNFLN